MKFIITSLLLILGTATTFAKLLDVSFVLDDTRLIPDKKEEFVPDSKVLYQFFEYKFTIDLEGLPEENTVHCQFINEYYSSMKKLCVQDKPIYYVPIGKEQTMRLITTNANNEVVDTREIKYESPRPSVFDEEWLTLEEPPRNWVRSKGYRGLALWNFYHNVPYFKHIEYQTFTDIYDNQLKPEEYQGKVLFVTLFGSQCTGSALEMALLDSVQNMYGDRVKFIAFGMQPKKTLLAEDAHSQRVLKRLDGYFVLSDPFKKLDYQFFGFDGTPAIFLIDKTGITRYAYMGYGCEGIDYNDPNLYVNGCIKEELLQALVEKLDAYLLE
ncbi:hypothetical protein GC194_01440 [bacterium]|nr:hypothetical protein [bacterium]